MRRRYIYYKPTLANKPEAKVARAIGSVAYVFYAIFALIMGLIILAPIFMACICGLSFLWPVFWMLVMLFVGTVWTLIRIA